MTIIEAALTQNPNNICNFIQSR